MKNKLLVLTLMFATFSCKDKSNEEWWSQFHGPKGSGIANEKAKPPIHFEEKNLKWKVNLPIGFSSPIVWENKILLTGSNEDQKQLLTICINRKNGKILWQGTITSDTIEKYHPISNCAQNSVVTDGERIVSCFGSCGLVCYNMNGEMQWKYSNNCARYMYGNASSPVIAGNKLIYLDDDGNDRFILALDKTTGKEIWKTGFEPPSFSNQGGQSTPCIYKDIIIVHKVGEITAYSLNDGAFVWGHKILTEASSSPIIAGKKVIISCWYNVSDESERPDYPDFEQLIQKYDLDRNNKIKKTELPEDLILYERTEIKNLPKTSGSIKEWFGLFDKNNDSEIDRGEWVSTVKMFKSIYYKPSGLVAIEAESHGVLTDSSILWRVSKNMSEVPSPIYYKNRIYMIKDGGVLTCLDPESGNIIYQNRIGAPGAYLASPVEANELIYLFGYNGKATILKTGDEFKIIAQSDLKDNIATTPAIIGNSIYIRTKTSLLAYSN